MRHSVKWRKQSGLLRCQDMVNALLTQELGHLKIRKARMVSFICHQLHAMTRDTLDWEKRDPCIKTWKRKTSGHGTLESTGPTRTTSTTLTTSTTWNRLSLSTTALVEAKCSGSQFTSGLGHPSCTDRPGKVGFKSTPTAAATKITVLKTQYLRDLMKSEKTASASILLESPLRMVSNRPSTKT